MYDIDSNEIQTFKLSLMSEDNAAILTAAEANVTVIPRVFTKEDTLLKIRLSGSTVETVSS